MSNNNPASSRNPNERDSYDVVIQLNESQASDPGILFPPGCRVSYNHQTSADNKRVELAEGIVTSVSLGRDSSKLMTNGFIFIYDVEASDSTGNTTTAQFVQEQLSYATNCPVYLTLLGNKRAEAEIAFSQKVTNDKGETMFAYVVIVKEGGCTRVEKSVKASKVRYRKVEYQAVKVKELPMQLSTNPAMAVSTIADSILTKEKNVSAENILTPSEEIEPGLLISKSMCQPQLSSLSERTSVAYAQECNDTKYQPIEKVHAKACAGSGESVLKGAITSSDAGQCGINDVLQRNQNENLKSMLPPRRVSNSTPLDIPLTPMNDSGDKVANSAHDQQEYKLLVPPCMYSSKTRADLINHIIGVQANGQRGHKLSDISRVTGCGVRVEARYGPMYISIKPFKENSIGARRASWAKELIENSLVEYLRDSQNKENALHERTSSSSLSKHAIQIHNANLSLQESLNARIAQEINDVRSQPETTLKRSPSSCNESEPNNISHTDADRSSLERPNKIQKKERSGKEELIVPSWVTNTQNNLLLYYHLIRKEVCIKTATDCGLHIDWDSSGKSQMKLSIKPRNEESKLDRAKAMVMDSIIEYIKDKHTIGRLLCEMLPSSPEGPVLCSHNSIMSYLEYAAPKLWVQLLDLPYLDRSCEYHGKCLLNDITLKEVRSKDCHLHVVGDNFGRVISYSGCQPYVLVYGTKKAQVLQATDVAKAAMRYHQDNCECKPYW